MRVRLRPAYPPEELAALYPVPHDHTKWPDHVVRVAETIDVALGICPPDAVVADLSCGDGVIAHAMPNRMLILGDLAPGWGFCGPIEHTIGRIPTEINGDPLDIGLFICCETIEHLDDPDYVLAQIRERADRLVLSTPLAETAANPEHYWAWDKDGVAELLASTGWTPVDYREVLHPLAQYQIWGCA